MACICALLLPIFCKTWDVPAQPNSTAWANYENWSPCFQVDVVGTTGAGDATIAGFLAALLRDMSSSRSDGHRAGSWCLQCGSARRLERDPLVGRDPASHRLGLGEVVQQNFLNDEKFEPRSSLGARRRALNNLGVLRALRGKTCWQAGSRQTRFSYPRRPHPSSWLPPILPSVCRDCRRVTASELIIAQAMTDSVHLSCKSISATETLNSRCRREMSGLIRPRFSLSEVQSGKVKVNGEGGEHGFDLRFLI